MCCDVDLRTVSLVPVSLFCYVIIDRVLFSLLSLRIYFAIPPPFGACMLQKWRCLAKWSSILKNVNITSYKKQNVIDK